MPRTNIPRYQHLEGAVFGALTVVALSSRYKPRRGAFLDCVCVCGNRVTVRADGLFSGHSTSCGCKKRQNIIQANTTHGMANQPEYKVWSAMLQRCNNPRCREYPNYGGRGIKVDPRWFSFENFLTDMGKRPDGLTLERRDNDGDYVAANCYWASCAVQNRNTRRNRFFTLDDERLCMAEWSRRAVVSPSTFNARIRMGWTLQDALSKPSIRKT